MDQKPGERACNLAMALVVAGTLRDLEGDEDPLHLLLRENREADAAWQAFVGEEGAMAKFDAEQSGIVRAQAVKGNHRERFRRVRRGPRGEKSALRCSRASVLGRAPPRRTGREMFRA